MFVALPVRQVYVEAGERVRLIDDIHPGQSVDRDALGAVANIGQISRCMERLRCLQFIQQQMEPRKRSWRTYKASQI